MSNRRIAFIAAAGMFLVVAIICASVIISNAVKSDKQVHFAQGSEASGTAGQHPGTQLDGSFSRVEVNADTVQNVIEKTLKRPQAYSRLATMVIYWQGGSSTTSVSTAVSGDAEMIIVNLPEKKYIAVTDTDCYIWYEGDKDYYTGTVSEDGGGTRTADEYRMMITYEDILELDRSYITDAGYTVYNGQRCIFVTYISGMLGYTTTCYVSVDLGLVISAETYDGETLVYSMSAGETDTSEPEASLFELPDGASILTSR